eukprot:1207047-Prorocentrum_lima.AAC.1
MGGMDVANTELVVRNPMVLKGEEYRHFLQLMKDLDVLVDVGGHGAMVGTGLSLVEGKGGRFAW